MPAELVTSFTRLPLSIHRYTKNLFAYVLPSCKYDLVLGLPWLEKHNPYISWKEHELTFGENCIAKGCCKFETTVPYAKDSQHDALKIKPLLQPLVKPLEKPLPTPLTPLPSLSIASILAAAFATAAR